MKTSHRIPKAIAIVSIVGIGLFYNMEDKNILFDPFRQLTVKWANEPEKSDTSIQETENRLFNYTKSIIKTSIQQIITNI